jgi:alkaline phosphatase
MNRRQGWFMPHRYTPTILLVALALAGCATPRPPQTEAQPRNMILFISDGAGYSALRATRLWQDKPLTVDTAGFRHAPMAVSQLSTRNKPLPAPEGLAQDPDLEFSSARACDPTPVPGETPALYGRGTSFPRGFAGYEWNRRTAPDSANTMSALMTGVRSYNNAINVNGAGEPLKTLAAMMAETGRAVGVVTTASISDATPGSGGGAHAASRAMRPEIAAQMFGEGLLMVIGGAGNPDWTNDATRRDTPSHSWVGAETWSSLKAGLPVGKKAVRWSLVEDADTIRALGAGKAALPDRLAMMAKASEGLQQYRGALEPGTEAPFATPLLREQPMLKDMALAALRRLDREKGGFFLVIEESNTDRASHANNLGRVIEARLAFEETVAAVLSFVDSKDSRATTRDTLVLVTADHDHLLFGPDSATVPFQPVRPDGPDADTLPDHRWLGNSHSNFAVPLFVKGPGADRILAARIDGVSGLIDAPMQDGACPVGPVLDQAAVGRALLALAKGETR